MIGIVNYGAGNLFSVKKALDHLGAKSVIIDSDRDIADVDKIILPGVGAFQPAVDKLRSTGLYDQVNDWLLADRPFLGICLGMQLLFAGSEEAETKGFGLFKGSGIRFKKGKVPQIGWNQVLYSKESCLMDEIENGSYFYFLHGYYVKTQDEIIAATTDYGVKYPSIIEKGNVRGVQFHPEKSGETGLKLLENWVRIC